MSWWMLAYFDTFSHPDDCQILLLLAAVGAAVGWIEEGPVLERVLACSDLGGRLHS